jgi:hypothetical protein
VQLDQVFHLPALAIDVLAKALRRVFERGEGVADVDLLAHPGLAGDRLQRAFEPKLTLRVAVRLIAGESAISTISATTASSATSPAVSLSSAQSIASTRLSRRHRSMLLQALGDMFDDGSHLGALRGARRAQDRHHRGAARHVINVHRREAALDVMGLASKKSACFSSGDVLPPRDLAAQRPVSRKHFIQITAVLGLTS